MTGPSAADVLIAQPLLDEFAGLSVRYVEVDASPGRSPKPVREQLAHISDRISGERAVNMRRDPIAHSYRIFFRYIGVDPDETRPPYEQVVLDRLRDGRVKSRSLVEDAVAIATLETGVALLALDGAALRMPLELRPSEPEEKLESQTLIPGTIVLADAVGPVAVVFASEVNAVSVGSKTERAVVCAIGAPGVPALAIEDALWKCAAIIRGS